MHHGDVSLFRLSVVFSVEDDAVDLPDLNVHGVYVTLRVKTKNRRPILQVDVFPVEQK